MLVRPPDRARLIGRDQNHEPLRIVTLRAEEHYLVIAQLLMSSVGVRGDHSKVQFPVR